MLSAVDPQSSQASAWLSGDQIGLMVATLYLVVSSCWRPLFDILATISADLSGRVATTRIAFTLATPQRTSRPRSDIFLSPFLHLGSVVAVTQQTHELKPLRVKRGVFFVVTL